MKQVIFLLLMFTVILLPVAFAQQLSLHDIVALTKQGYTHEQILAKIAETNSRFNLTPEEVEWLRSEGVNEWVIRFLVIAKRQEPDAEFLERGDIQREGAPVRGGRYYDQAMDIEPGIYKLDHQLRANEYDYFKISLKNGQRLTCTVRTPEVSPHAGITIHSQEKTKISEALIVDQRSTSKACFYELFDSDAEQKTVYLVIGSYFPVNEHVIYQISREDHFDGGSSTDAGNHFDSAVSITAGNYENNWLPLDDVDMYKLNLAKGEELSVKVIPHKARAIYRLTILNEDREGIASNTAKEIGSVAKTWAVNENHNQEVYIKVDHAGHSEPTPGKYSLSAETNPISQSPIS